MQRIFSLNQACEHLGISRRTALRWIYEGRIKAFKLGGGRLWRIRERDLQNLMKGQDQPNQTA